MNKLAATLGILVVGGRLSLGDLCDTGNISQVGASLALIAVADAKTPDSGDIFGRAAGPALPPLPATKSVTLRIQGMTCGGCVFGVRKVLSRLSGVSKAEVSYEKGRAIVTYDPALVTIAQMIAAIKTLGYSATVTAS